MTFERSGAQGHCLARFHTQIKCQAWSPPAHSYNSVPSDKSVSPQDETLFVLKAMADSVGSHLRQPVAGLVVSPEIDALDFCLHGPGDRLLVERNENRVVLRDLEGRFFQL